MKKLIIVLIISLGLISCEKEEAINFESFEIHEGLSVNDILNSDAFDASGVLIGGVYTLSIRFETINIVIELNECGLRSCKANNIDADFYEVGVILYEIYINFTVN